MSVSLFHFVSCSAFGMKRFRFQRFHSKKSNAIFDFHCHYAIGNRIFASVMTKLCTMNRNPYNCTILASFELSHLLFFSTNFLFWLRDLFQLFFFCLLFDTKCANPNPNSVQSIQNKREKKKKSVKLYWRHRFFASFLLRLTMKTFSETVERWKEFGTIVNGANFMCQKPIIYASAKIMLITFPSINLSRVSHSALRSPFRARHSLHFFFVYLSQATSFQSRPIFTSRWVLSLCRQY